MASAAQLKMLSRLSRRAFEVGGPDEAACAWLDATEKRGERGGVDAETLTNAEVSEVKESLERIISRPRCSHCHEPTERGDHRYVRYYDDFYGPECGLS